MSADVKWIDINKRLPKIGYDVLLSIEKTDGYSDSYIGYYDGGGRWAYVNEDYRLIPVSERFCKVVAWMELPKPYNK